MAPFRNEYDFLSRSAPMIKTKDFTEAGFHRSVIQKLILKGLLVQIERGIYLKADSFEDEFFLLQKKYSKGVFSGNTALFLHSYSDRTPSKFQMTFPRGYHASSIKDENIFFKTAVDEIYRLGITKVNSPFGNEIYAYDIEKSICDLLRGRSNTDIQIVLDAVKRYAKSKDKNLPKLMEYAEKLRVKDKVVRYLEVLL